MIRVAIVAPTLALRAGLRVLLSENQAVQVTGEASRLSGLDTEALAVDVIVLAFTGGLDVPAPLPASIFDDWAALNIEAACLILAAEGATISSGRLGREILARRAWGFLSLDTTQEQLISAVRALHAGLFVSSPSGLAELFYTSPDQYPPGLSADGTPAALTGREVEVLQLLAQGLANKQIALELEISEHTVKFHVSSIFSKLEASSRTEAVRKGTRLGLITF